MQQELERLKEGVLQREQLEEMEEGVLQQEIDKLKERALQQTLNAPYSDLEGNH